MARCALRLGLLVFAFLLASCSGGGGDGGGDTPRLNVSPTSFTFTATQNGATPPAQQASVSVSGGSVAVGIESNSASGFVNATFNITGQTTGTITLTPLSPSFVSPGTHTGTVVVRGCGDQFCSSGNVAGSPVSINVTYTVQVAQGLRGSPQSLSFTQVKGLAAPASQTLGLSDSRGLSYAWNASIVYQSITTGWLNINGAATASGASLPANLNVSINPTTTVGTLNAIIRVTGNGSTLDIPVSYALNEPTLTRAPAQMTFTAVASGSIPNTQTVTLSTQNSLPVNYTTSIVYGAGQPTGWLNQPPSGTAPGDVAVGVSRTNLPLGTYTATLTFASAQQMVSVNVTYNVVTSSITFTPGSASFAIGPSSTATALSQTIAVGSTAGPLSWTNATSNQPWLTVSPTSGTTGSSVTLSIDPAQLDALDPGLQSATITFSYTQPGVGATSTPLSVTLNLTLPKIASVSPYVALSGPGQQVILRGKGFNNAGGAALDFGGTSVPASSYTVASDTEIRVTHPAFTAGPARRIKFANSLADPSVVRSTADLVVVDAQLYALKSLTYPDPELSVRRIIYDAERKQLLLAVSLTSGAAFVDTPGAIYRYAFDGTNLAAAPARVAVPGLHDFGFSTDGKKLLVISGTSVTPYDPATLVPGTPASVSLPFSSSFLEQIVVANDGNAVITTESTISGSEESYRYSIADATFTRFANSFSCPQAGGSANGSRIVVVQNCISADQSVFQYNASSGQLAATSVRSSESFPHPALDRNATRIVLGSHSVYNSNFQLLGTIGFGLADALSPDGKKAYTYETLTTVPQSGKVHVYDLTASITPGSAFPEILPATPTPSVLATNIGRVRMTVSPDGGTLFIAGDTGIVAMPAP